MSYEELEAEQASLRARRDKELQKLNGQVPPFGISEDHPGCDFDTYDTRSWLVDEVLAPRLNKDMEDVVKRLDAATDVELRARLTAEYHVLLARIRAHNARYDERQKSMEARDKARAEARKESRVEAGIRANGDNDFKADGVETIGRPV